MLKFETNSKPKIRILKPLGRVSSFGILLIRIWKIVSDFEIRISDFC